MNVLRKYGLYILFLMVSLGTAYLAHVWMGQYEADQKSARFLRLKPDVRLLRDKTVLTQEMIEIAELPEKFLSGLEGVAVPAAPDIYRKALIGRRSVMDVPGGALILFQHFQALNNLDLSQQISPGNRALTVAVSAENTVGYFVRPGSRVDLIGTFVEPQQSTPGQDPRANVKTRLLLENVKVLAVGAARNLSEYQRLGGSGYSTATFDVTPRQASLLTFAKQQLSGPLTMVLRRNDEKPDVADGVPAISWDDLKANADVQNETEE